MVRIVVMLLFVGCGKSNPNCDSAVKHVMRLVQGPEGMPPPSAEEQKVIDQVASMTLGRCNEEGLSDAQRDCILAAKSLTEHAFLMCPALVAKKPTWIIAPIGHPELVPE